MPRRRESKSEPMFAGGTAIIFACFFLVAVAAVVAFSAWDATRKSNLEDFAQNTAVGDPHLYRIPTPAPGAPVPVMTWNGRQLTPMSYKKAKIDDTAMRRVHRDEMTGLSLYRPDTATSADELFLKVENGRYLPLSEN